MAERYERLLVQNRRFCSNSWGGLIDPEFQVEGVAPHQPFFFSVNYAKLSFVWYKNMDRSFFRFVTIHACDRWTDGQTGRILIAIPRLHYMQRGEN